MPNNNNYTIHKTSIIESGAEIADNVTIGPYCIIGKDVKIGKGTIIKSHSVIEGNTSIGENNTIYSFVAIGQKPQDLKYKGENSSVTIGDNNQIREHVTIHIGTKDGGMKTIIGSNCLFMIGSHIAHDCYVGNNVILANNATLAGHVYLEDNVIIGGLSAVKQFVRIGKHAMIGGMSGIGDDVVPYSLSIADGIRSSMVGLNLVGLKRSIKDKDKINSLREFYKNLFLSKNSDTLQDRITNLRDEYKDNDMAIEMMDFIDNSTAICQPKQENK